LNDGNTASALQLITKMRGNLENAKDSPNLPITEERKEYTYDSELDLSKVSKELSGQPEVRPKGQQKPTKSVGKLSLKVSQGKLFRNTEIFGNMDPYI
jgi:hypothetical protein